MTKEAPTSNTDIVLDEPEPSAANALETRIKIRLEESDNIPPTGLFISHNGKPFMLSPGREVEVPEYLLDILDHAVESKPILDEQTQQVLYYRPKLRYPYSRL